MATASTTRTISADRARIWKCWTDSSEFAGWFWPERFQATASIDALAGGRWRVASETAGMAASGRFTTVEPDRALVYTWQWDGEELETLVTVTFTESGTGSTDIRVVHDGFETDEAAVEHQQGWNDCLDRLPAAAI
jgi:uncharacterized protein YndB with AHSA1/START domain